VLALRLTEARARDRTEPYQLGGATDEALQLGPTLNSRQLSLRGYRGDEPALRGQNARVATLEWRATLADIDRHAMVPAVGINRLSAAVFFDVGGAWSSGSGPSTWRRGVGVELLGEVKLLYALGLQLRLGVARGLDEPKETRGYFTAGRSF
jgi:outer membrane protein assembly factor BamA